MRCKESYIPMYFTMDAMGYSCFSDLSRHPERFLLTIARLGTTRAKDFVAAIKRKIQAFVMRPRQADVAVLHRRYAGQGNLCFYSIFDRIKRRIFS